MYNYGTIEELEEIIKKKKYISIIHIKISLILSKNTILQHIFKNINI
jgi:hypothetical protein